jgi:hypothetical protein
MQSFQSSTWDDVERLRGGIAERPAGSVEEAAQAIAASLAASSPTVTLARLFVVLPFSKLPPSDRNFAQRLAGPESLDTRTPVLSLLGTAGRKAEWCDRARSVGHRAIPLTSAAFVRGIPMIANLLASLDVSLSALDDGKVLDTRQLLGGKNAAFFVADARRTEDSDGRRVIPSGDFVDAYGVRTVFGMGGAYVDGTLAVAVVFTSETVDRLVVDRFPSLIGNFKMATSKLMTAGRVFGEGDGAA